MWLLLLSVACAILTLNGYRPVRARVLLLPSFLLAWLVTELPAMFFALYAAAGLLAVQTGALAGAAGWVGLAILGAAAAGLFGFMNTARSSRSLLDGSLRSALGVAYEQAVIEDGQGAHWIFSILPFLRLYPGVQQRLDIRYAEGAGRCHLLDVYSARDRREPKGPVVLQIHGGGWFTGHKRQQALPMLFHLAARGFVCVSINYRLSPRATWPDHLIDCKLALAWIKEHIPEYGGDPSYVIVTGGSAGGHLASMVALTPNQARYQPGFEHVDTSVRACVPFYGVYDFTERFGHASSRALRGLVSRWLLKKSFEQDPEAFAEASPMTHIGPHAPPFFIIQGGADSIVSIEDARAFAKLLSESSKQPVVYAELPGAHHAFEILHSTRTGHVVWAVTRFLSWLRARDTAQPVTPRPFAPGEKLSA